MATQLFTVGYEGRTIHGFIAHLQNNNVECVVDVRELPLSRKRGFSKTGLRQRLSHANIEYVHLRELGSPKPLREELTATGDYATFFSKMDRHLRNKQAAVETAYGQAMSKTCCLMCFERSVTYCHRKIVARMIKARNGNGLQIKHI